MWLAKVVYAKWGTRGHRKESQAVKTPAAPSLILLYPLRTSSEPALEKFSRSLDVTALPFAYCCLDTECST